MSSLERYADSSLARQEIRRQEASFKARARVPDYFDFENLNQEDSAEEVEARRTQDAAYRKRLAQRILGAMCQMEKICPPQGGIA